MRIKFQVYSFLNLLIAAFLLLSVSSAGYAADSVVVERHALVIGNSDYLSQPLLNPVNDATDMAQQLQTLGYKIHTGGPMLDLDRLGIERAVRAFAQQLPENANALFYYAGHGMSVGRDNYLIPTNHNLESEEQLPDRAVSLRSVIRVLKNANREGLNVVLLDACRDNPLQNNYRSTRAGLTRLEDIPRGVFVGYAADAGQLAEDGDGRNGTYTGELLNVMREKPNVIIELAHKEVSARVFEKTGGKQFPVSENKVFGDWCFGDCSSNAPSSTPAATVPAPAASVTATPEAPPAKTTQPPTLPATVKEERGFNKTWLAAGAAAAILIGVLALSGGGGDDDDSPSSEDNFTIEILPPDLSN